MSSSGNDVEVTVEVSGEKVIVRSSGGGKVTGDLRLDDLTRDTLFVFNDLLADKARIKQRRELEVLGRHLFNVLFDDTTRPFIENRLKEASNTRRLRIMLDLKGGPRDLAAFPWEYLYYYSDSANSFFFSTRSDLVLARFISKDEDRGLLVPKENRLRLLLVISAPKGLPVESGGIITILQRLREKQTTIDLECLEESTVPNLIDKLESFRPHVVHFMGHGNYGTNRREAEIYLLAADGQSPRPVTGSSIAEFFTNLDSVPRLVVLHLCEGGTDDLEANFASIAPSLVMAGVQAVVAMRHRIPDKAALAFTRTFYRELADGSTVDSAVQQGRWWITLEDSDAYNRRDFGTPVLYMVSRDGILLPTATAREVSGTQHPTGAPQIAGAAGSVQPPADVGVTSSAPAPARGDNLVSFSASPGGGLAGGQRTPLTEDLLFELRSAVVPVAKSHNMTFDELQILFSSLFNELFGQGMTVELLGQVLAGKVRASNRGIYLEVCRAIDDRLKKWLAGN